MNVFLVIDSIDYGSEDVVAGFTDEIVAVDYADTEPLFSDNRRIRRVQIDNPFAYPEFTEYVRYSR